ncbi:hypothetical protein M5K25_005457 [Dendrobium thyrsiflorum]|uniref:Uncharacterized protein n=1 Tax=Dendrobium thyrsiflorum TaxID=117978 RepID=A0ABD0VQ18_DENTH
MSPDQSPEALFEGSKRNSEPHFTLKRDPRLKESKETQDRSCTLAPPRPPPDHQSKALHFAGPPPEGPSLRRTTSRRPYTSPDHHLKALHFAGPPSEGSSLRRTTSRRPYTSPDHHLKALHFAGPPIECPTLRRTTT